MSGLVEMASSELANEHNRYLSVDLSELPSDELLRHRAAKFAGSIALGASVEFPGRIRSLDIGLALAANGDPQARAMIEANVSSDLIERNYKAGFITPKVPLSVQDGQLYQYGQSYQSILANSLKLTTHPIIMRRTLAEVNNGFRLNELWSQGAYEEYSVAIFSLSEDLPEYGFFTDSMSCSIQLVGQEGDGLAIESAFVAGKTEQRQFDQSTVAKLYAQLAGVDISGLCAAEILDRPLLIPKTLLKNGVIDLVKLYDELAGGTFFGTNKQPEDYQLVKRRCLQWNQDSKKTTKLIVDQLINEAQLLDTPNRASQRLNVLAAQASLELAVKDHSIDPRVFGQVAAAHLANAREALDKGIYDQYYRSMALASANNKSTSCPSALAGDHINGDQESDESSLLADCEFVSLECPQCKKKHVKTIVKKGIFYGDCGCSSDKGRSIIKSNERSQTKKTA